MIEMTEAERAEVERLAIIMEGMRCDRLCGADYRRRSEQLRNLLARDAEARGKVAVNWECLSLLVGLAKPLGGVLAGYPTGVVRTFAEAEAALKEAADTMNARTIAQARGTK